MCIFKEVFGIPCPGCGMTRAFIELIKGDVNGAFHFHPLFPIIIIYVIASIFHRRHWAKQILSLRVFTIVVILFVGVYSIRMLLYFPNVEPMEYNQSNIIQRIFK